MAQSQPPCLSPQWADRFLRLLCPADLQEELLGDLHEPFERQAHQLGASTARRLYAWEVIRFCRPYFIGRQVWARLTSSAAVHPANQADGPAAVSLISHLLWRAGERLEKVYGDQSLQWCFCQSLSRLVD
jgi:hypothetical protein